MELNMGRKAKIKTQMKKEIVELFADGMTVKQIVEALKSKNISVCPSTIYDLVKEPEYAKYIDDKVKSKFAGLLPLATEMWEIMLAKGNRESYQIARDIFQTGGLIKKKEEEVKDLGDVKIRFTPKKEITADDMEDTDLQNENPQEKNIENPKPKDKPDEQAPPIAKTA